jgi:hypothetical protein
MARKHEWNVAQVMPYTHLIRENDVVKKAPVVAAEAENQYKVGGEAGIEFSLHYAATVAKKKDFQMTA